jgi:orotidine-5'-phosphate decarboxylase
VTDPGIIVALDFPARDPVDELIARLDPARCRVKVGHELFTACGPRLVSDLAGAGFEVFLDLKFHDIPNTVSAACAAAADLGAWMINVHASGGAAMLDAARDAVQRSAHRPILIAVTVLTSLEARDLETAGVRGRTVAEQVLALAVLAQTHGLDGVVCSAREAALLRRQLGTGFVLVTPGVRPAGGDRADQARTATPAEAVAAGSDYLVIGRPITRAAEPMQALLEIEREIAAAAAGRGSGSR